MVSFLDMKILAPIFWCERVKDRNPDQISFTIKKALEMEGPVIIGIPVDYRDNHKFLELCTPACLNKRNLSKGKR